MNVNVSFGPIVYLLASYAAAAVVSSHVNMDLAATNWTNFWTWFWLIFALPFLGVVAFAGIVTIIVVAAGGRAIREAFR